MPVTLDWLGCATFRLTIDDLVVFCDAYMDRVPLAPEVGLTTADVDRADYVLVGHSHFDHIAGVEAVAAKTGARVIGSNESARVLREAGVDGSQLMPAQGGERYELAPGVSVQVIPWETVEGVNGRLHRFALRDPGLELLEIPWVWMK